MSKEKLFYDTLRNIFVGAKIEGKGGFINLMSIKSNYYLEIENLLHQDVENTLMDYPTFREELFDKLYSFFSRYFTESGSIYFNSTPFHNNIYEKVYTDEKDVILFWKTQMLYYVKSDRIFCSMPIEFDNLKFYFDASDIESKKANEKRTLIYTLKNIDADNTINLLVINSERGKKTKNDEILKAIKKGNIHIKEEQLERAFRVFEKQSEVDFFINKDAKSFLQEQFKLWSYQYFWEGGNKWNAKRVNELQKLKDIAFKIIDFISQFENELVKIWNKLKFVKNSNYVVTLDRIKDFELIKKIIRHQNFSKQIKEWKTLGIIDDDFNKNDIIEDTLIGKNLVKKYEHLPIDTKYFKNLEFEILSRFDDLDKSLDGWLIKSENYQALNTILPKFKEKVQTIYIDPPFNLDSSDQFMYRTNYKNANWATLLENRLKLAKDWLNEKGSIFVRCDYNGNWIVRPLMNEIFGEENFRNELIINKSNKQGAIDKRFNPATETLFLYSKIIESLINPQFRKREKQGGWIEMHSPKENKDSHTVIFNSKTFVAPKGRHWSFAKETIDRLISENRIRVTKKKYIDVYGNRQSEVLEYLMSEAETIESNWTDILGYSTTTGFQTENSEQLLKRVIDSTSKQGDILFDFFLGSGTTTAVAHKLGRKWLGVEMGNHFDTVILPRMKKVLAYDKSGISKEVKEYQGGGFFKYYELEQYEETLDNCKYKDGDVFHTPSETPYQEYVFMKDEKMLECLTIDYRNNKVKVDLNKLYKNIDISETLSNLTGKWIKKISPDEVEFEDGTKINIKDLDYKLIKPLIWW
jgi:adenine specific DNA methylase Mod